MKRGFTRACEVLIYVTAIVLAAGCNKPTPGGKCEVGQAICVDSSSVIACQGEVFALAHCGGPSGCSKVGSRIACDDSIANEGDVCLEWGSENRACGADQKTSLRCSAGKFEAVQKCRGPKGCQIKGDAVSCDSSLAEKGDLCTSPGTFACTMNKKARLACANGKFSLDRYCRGPTACHELDLACDETVSDVGDPCGVSGMFACNPDGSERLVCLGGQYVKDQRCPKKGCTVMREGRISCL